MVNSATSLQGSYPAVQSTASMSINKVTKEMAEKTAQIGNHAEKLNIKVSDPPPPPSSMSINEVTKNMKSKTASIGDNAEKLNIKVDDRVTSTASMSINKVTKEMQAKTAQIGDNEIARMTGKGGKLNIFV
jgi:hypothetical protein